MQGHSNQKLKIVLEISKAVNNKNSNNNKKIQKLKNKKWNWKKRNKS